MARVSLGDERMEERRMVRKEREKEEDTNIGKREKIKSKGEKQR